MDSKQYDAFFGVQIWTVMPWPFSWRARQGVLLTFMIHDIQIFVCDDDRLQFGGRAARSVDSQTRRLDRI